MSKKRCCLKPLWVLLSSSLLVTGCVNWPTTCKNGRLEALNTGSGYTYYYCASKSKPQQQQQPGNEDSETGIDNDNGTGTETAAEDAL